MRLAAAHSPSTFFKISICKCDRPSARSSCLIRFSCSASGCAAALLPPKRSLGSGFHFILPTVVEIGSDLILAARLCHVAALQTFQPNLPLLFRGSLDSRLSRHSRLLAEAPSLTNFHVQFYRGALQRNEIRSNRNDRSRDRARTW